GAGRFNALVEEVRALRNLGGGAETEFYRTTEGMIVGAGESRGSIGAGRQGAACVRMAIVEVLGNALVCVPEGQSETVYVAKPLDLQKTRFDGLSVHGFSYVYDVEDETGQTRTSDDGE